jgi:hypothetical protein
MAELKCISPRNRRCIVQVPARAIVWAAHHRRGELCLGSPTLLVIQTNKVVPGLLDRYLARTGFDQQQTPVDGLTRRDRYNLFEPLQGISRHEAASMINPGSTARNSGWRDIAWFWAFWLRDCSDTQLREGYEKLTKVIGIEQDASRHGQGPGPFAESRYRRLQLRREGFAAVIRANVKSARLEISPAHSKIRS